MNSIDTSDSITDIDKSSQLNIEDVALKTDNPIKPTMLVNISGLMNKHTTRTELTTEGDGASDYGGLNMISVAQKVEDEGDDSYFDFAPAEEAYDNRSMEPTMEPDNESDSTDLDTLAALGDSISDNNNDIGDTGVVVVKLAIERISKRLGIPKDYIAPSLESLQEGGSRVAMKVIHEGIVRTVKLGREMLETRKKASETQT
jgi:hypothetical protein